MAKFTWNGEEREIKVTTSTLLQFEKLTGKNALRLEETTLTLTDYITILWLTWGDEKVSLEDFAAKIPFNADSMKAIAKVIAEGLKNPTPAQSG